MRRRMLLNINGYALMRSILLREITDFPTLWTMMEMFWRNIRMWTTVIRILSVKEKNFI